MAIWRLEPKAAPDDPRWLDHEIWQEVIVRAPSSGMARLVAAELERDPKQPPAGNESESFQSGFEDDKLYTVRPHNEGEAQSVDADAKPCILRAVRAETPGPETNRR